MKPETTLEELARLLMNRQISGAPVVDDKGKIIGIVTENDLISKNSRLHIPTILRLFDAYIPLGTSKMESDMQKMARHGRRHMQKGIITVYEEASVAYIATI